MKLKVNLMDKLHEKYYNTKKNYKSDSGFDIYCTQTVLIPPMHVETIKSGVKCQPELDGTESGYYLYPRSSISKTPLMLANSVGIIDVGYTGEIMAKVRNLSNETYVVYEGTSLFQLCQPNLKPFDDIVFVESLEKTERNDGGFGSTNSLNQNSLFSNN